MRDKTALVEDMSRVPWVCNLFDPVQYRLAMHYSEAKFKTRPSPPGSYAPHHIKNQPFTSDQV